MPRIPKHTAQAAPPRQSGGAFARNIGALTRMPGTKGLQQMGAGISDLGQAVAEIKMHRDRIDARNYTARVGSELTEFSNKAAQEYGDTWVETEKQRNQLLTGYEKDFDKFYQEKLKEAPNELARRSMRNDYLRMKPHLTNRVRSVLARQLDTGQTTAAQTRYNSLLSEGRVEEAKAQIQADYEDSLITDETRQQLLKDLPEMAEELQAERRRSELWNVLTDIAKNESWQDALTYLQDPDNHNNLDADAIDALTENVQTQARIESEINENQVEGIFNETSAQWGKTLAQISSKVSAPETDLWSEINAFRLPEGLERQHGEDAETFRAKWRKKVSGYVSATDATQQRKFSDDPAVEAEVRRLVEQGQISRAEVWDYVGEGLSPGTANTLTDDIDIYKSHFYKQGDEFLRNAFNYSPQLGFMGPEGHNAGPYYQAAYREWSNWIEANKEAITSGKIDDNAILEKARHIGGLHMAGYLKNEQMVSIDEVLADVEMTTGLDFEPAAGEEGVIRRANESPPREPEEDAVRTPPENYPDDAVWDDARKTWKVQRDGKWYIVE